MNRLVMMGFTSVLNLQPDPQNTLDMQAIVLSICNKTWPLK